MQFNSRVILLVIAIATLGCKDSPSTTSTGVIEMGEPVLQNSLRLDQNGGLVYYKGLLFTGSAYKAHCNGKYARVITYYQGRKEGYERHYFTDGQLSYECFYKNGKKDGLAKSWWRNANLRSESHFRNGVVHGVQKQWYKSGTRFKELNIVDGKEEGLQKAWRENGKIYNNYEARNGRTYGLKRANLCYELTAENIEDN